MAADERGGHLSAVDKRLGDYDAYWMEVMLIVGLLCSHPRPLSRSSMRQVVQILAGESPAPSILACRPPYFDSGEIKLDLLHSMSWSSVTSQSGSASVRTTASDESWRPSGATPGSPVEDF
jgi:hypothetical protein